MFYRLYSFYLHTRLLRDNIFADLSAQYVIIHKISYIQEGFMEIRILEKEKQQCIYNDAYQILELADNEFVPPLSSRSCSLRSHISP